MRPPPLEGYIRIWGVYCNPVRAWMVKKGGKEEVPGPFLQKGILRIKSPR